MHKLMNVCIIKLMNVRSTSVTYSVFYNKIGISRYIEYVVKSMPFTESQMFLKLNL